MTRSIFPNANWYIYRILYLSFFLPQSCIFSQIDYFYLINNFQMKFIRSALSLIRKKNLHVYVSIVLIWVGTKSQKVMRKAFSALSGNLKKQNGLILLKTESIFVIIIDNKLSFDHQKLSLASLDFISATIYSFISHLGTNEAIKFWVLLDFLNYRKTVLSNQWQLYKYNY